MYIIFIFIFRKKSYAGIVENVIILTDKFLSV